MLKLFTISRCSLCTVVSTQTVPTTYKIQNQVLNLEKVKTDVTYRRYPKNTKNKQVFVRASQDHIRTVNELLNKHNVNKLTIKTDRRIFNETVWNIEKKILLLKEIGLETVSTSHIVNFIPQMFLKVPLYKAYLGLPVDVKLSEKLLSIVESSKIDPQVLNNLDDMLAMKFYYSEVLTYYLEKELGLTKEQIKHISCKKYAPLIYNSFTLLQRLLKMLKDNYNFSNSLIMKNFFWLFGHHPDHGLAVIKMVQNHYKELNVYKVILRFPKLLNYELDELKVLLSHMKNCGVTAQMIQSAPEIFHLSPSEFKGRLDYLLQNPFTLVYQKHPRFLLLVRDYQTTLPRIKYLEEKNLKHANIYTLTTFHNYKKQLTAVRKVNKPNLISFLELQFDKDVSEELLKRLERHPYRSCVPLVQMNETITYLKEVYPKMAIYKHIYAVLYSVSDLKAAREEIMKSPQYSKLSAQHVLSMCLYKIEKMFHFSGSGALTPDKYAESLKDYVNHENKEESLKGDDNHENKK